MAPLRTYHTAPKDTAEAGARHELGLDLGGARVDGVKDVQEAVERFRCGRLDLDRPTADLAALA